MGLWNLSVFTRPRLSLAAYCAHCGLPAPAPCFRDGRGADGPAFCCRACRQVYDLALELSPEGEAPAAGAAAVPPPSGRDSSRRKTRT